MDVQLTNEEVDEIDSQMNDHMYHHSISNHIPSFGCTAGCRRDALKRIINDVLREKPTRHRLIRVVVYSKIKATYLCECGQPGVATMASHLGSLAEIERRAVKNHEMHQVRALRKKG